MPEAATLVQLTREVLAGHLPALVAVDDEVRAELGASYSRERWGGEEFEKDLPGKWDLSVLALGGSSEVCAFLVASEKPGATLYVHRFAVKPACRGRALGFTLIRALAQAGVARNLVRMALVANRGNSAALGFYRSLGFEDAPGLSPPDNQRLEAATRRLARL